MGPQLYRCGNLPQDNPIRRVTLLQWGRNFIVAEILPYFTRSKFVWALQWGRNFIVAEIWQCRHHQWFRCRSFNGAATLSLRKYVKEYTFKPSSIGFNGAATLSLRKCAGQAIRPTGGCTLQWGRNFIVAEIGERCQGPGSCRTASMGPQLYRCGNLPPQPAYFYAVDASMGPQLYRCGNVVSSLSHANANAPLQWGRNFIVAEIDSVRDAMHIIGLALQWGRNFIVAEIQITIKLESPDGTASMGPQLYRCGNARTSSTVYQVTTSFNGAATLSLRKW